MRFRLTLSLINNHQQLLFLCLVGFKSYPWLADIRLFWSNSSELNELRVGSAELVITDSAALLISWSAELICPVWLELIVYSIVMGFVMGFVGREFSKDPFISIFLSVADHFAGSGSTSWNLDLETSSKKYLDKFT